MLVICSLTHAKTWREFLQAGRTAIMLAAQKRAHNALKQLCAHEEGAIDFVNKVFFSRKADCVIFAEFSYNGRTAELQLCWPPDQRTLRNSNCWLRRKRQSITRTRLRNVFRQAGAPIQASYVIFSWFYFQCMFSGWSHSPHVSSRFKSIWHNQAIVAPQRGHQLREQGITCRSLPE